jgi:uncharacterized protein HemX
MFTSLDTVRRVVSQAASETVTASDFAIVLRFMAVLSVVFGCLGMYLWSQMQVTRISVALDEARSELARAETIQGRLLLERSMLTQPNRLQQEANLRGLVLPVTVVQVGAQSLSEE